jgi:hypothetical protein
MLLYEAGGGAATTTVGMSMSMGMGNMGAGTTSVLPHPAPSAYGNLSAGHTSNRISDSQVHPCPYLVCNFFLLNELYDWCYAVLSANGGMTQTSHATQAQHGGSAAASVGVWPCAERLLS